MLKDGSIDFKARASYAAEAVMYGITWSNTPQGGDFWQPVYDRLKSVNSDRLLPYCVPVDGPRTIMEILHVGLMWSDLPEGADYWKSVFEAGLTLLPKSEADEFRRWCKPLLQEKRKLHLSPDRLIKWLEKRGWTQLGRGAYSTVLSKKGTDQVIKIGRRRDAWPEYVAWAKEAGYAGTFAPNVHAMKLYGDGSWYVARMDKLDGTISDLQWKREKAKLISNNRYEISAILSGRNKLLPEQRTSDILDERLDMVRADFIDEKFPGLIKFAKDFHARFKEDDIDDHLANWMMKGDQVVLTDPLTAMGSSLSPDVLRIKSTAKDNARLAA